MRSEFLEFKGSKFLRVIAESEAEKGVLADAIKLRKPASNLVSGEDFDSYKRIEGFETADGRDRAVGYVPMRVCPLTGLILDNGHTVVKSLWKSHLQSLESVEWIEYIN